jgi:hypothetical protein
MYFDFSDAHSIIKLVSGEFSISIRPFEILPIGEAFLFVLHICPAPRGGVINVLFLMYLKMTFCYLTIYLPCELYKTLFCKVTIHLSVI